MRTKKHHRMKSILFASLGVGCIIAGITVIWLGTLKLPDFKSFDNRKIQNSTRIYDRTGQVLLYDVHQDVKRTVIPYDQMGGYIKNATVAIEDAHFYEHNGVRPTSIIRAILNNIVTGKFSQGGSTITQQVIKNTLLTQDKKVSRKLKEIVLSLKLERTMNKEQILALYLNESPYGGNIYGVEQASETYFGIHAQDLDLAQSAYLAAIPQAPSYYSPFGNHKTDLETRKNLVLQRMLDLNFIDQNQYNQAKAEVVAFLPPDPHGIKAPHFVFYILDQLNTTYGEDLVREGGLKVTTTLDYTMQQVAEDVVKRNALINATKYNASNAALVAMDPKTGQILTMVGSRDYFDTKIDGAFNVATALRQPGSSFKPFVYAAAFDEGFTPETVLFDLPTEFNASCSPYGAGTNCYHPHNFDGGFDGPMTIREALARSINIPAIKTLYIVGIDNAIKKARDMGITTLTDSSRYGLTLVLGGGEVKLLDMTSAYGTFATGGVRHETSGILKVEDANGAVLQSFTDSSANVLSQHTANEINDVLSDNAARQKTFGLHSKLVVPGHEVAVKTGTTNDLKDAWIIGYTPSLVVGGWTGNNDNQSMTGPLSSILVAPLWNEFMVKILASKPDESFERNQPDPNYTQLKPVLRGLWQGGESFTIDTISGKLATEFTPKETQKEKVITDVHDILYWVDKNNPLGPKPANPYNDPQFTNWEIPVQNWWATHKGAYPVITDADKPTTYDDIHTANSKPIFTITTPADGGVLKGTITPTIQYTDTKPFARADEFVNGNFIGSTTNINSLPTINLANMTDLTEHNEITIVVYDIQFNKNEQTISFGTVSQ